MWGTLKLVLASVAPITFSAVLPQHYDRSVSDYILSTINATNRPETINQINSKRKYETFECTDAQYDRLEIIVDKARESVKPAIHELTTAQHFSLPFMTLIGERENYRTLAIEILEKIWRFANVVGRKPLRWSNKPPSFICTSPETKKQHQEIEDFDPYQTCVDNPLSWAFGSEKFRYIFLCPTFWTHEVEGPSTRPKSEICPEVKDNQWIDEQGVRLAGWQKYLIVHELIHQYFVDGGLSKTTEPREVYSLNDCTNLAKASHRIRNPNNLEFYVAMVNEGCEDAPRANDAPFNRPPESDLANHDDGSSSMAAQFGISYINDTFLGDSSNRITPEDVKGRLFDDNKSDPFHDTGYNLLDSTPAIVKLNVTKSNSSTSTTFSRPLHQASNDAFEGLTLMNTGAIETF